MRAKKFFVVRKIKSIDKVPRNAMDDERQSQIWLMRCAKKDSFCGGVKKSEKERKRAKKSEKSRQKRENLIKILSCFFRQTSEFFCSFSSLSLSSLSDKKALLKEQTP